MSAADASLPAEPAPGEAPAPERRAPRPRATLRDVAALAGVSVPTASKAINNRVHVNAATRSRVLAAAEQLGFAPNVLARGLLDGRTGTVGLLTSDLVGRFSLPILMGAEDAFGAGRTSVFLCDARGDTIRERHHLAALLARQVDGLIVVGSRTDPRPSLGRDLPIPVVYVYAESDDPDHDLSLVPDNVGAGALAVEHLLSMGRRRIAHVGGDPTYLATTDRARGIADALAAAGLEPAAEPMYGDWSEPWGVVAARAMLAQGREIDAILCGSDQVARGVLDGLRESGRAVPDDIAVMGFDNWEVMIAGSRPRLTSVDMNLEALGRMAAERLFAAIDGSLAAGLERFPCRIVPGQTTSPAA
jgi:LacI family transcriptional regulator